MHGVVNNVMTVYCVVIGKPISVISGSISGDQIIRIHFEGKENSGQLLSDKFCSAGIAFRFFSLTGIPPAFRKAGDIWGNTVVNGLENELLVWMVEENAPSFHDLCFLGPVSTST